MKFAVTMLVCMFGVLGPALQIVWAQPPSSEPVAAEKQEQKAKPVYTVDEYDPQADAAADLAKTIQRTQQSGKRILLEIGGDW